jgi:multiple sugar transport system permease protein
MGKFFSTKIEGKIWLLFNLPAFLLIFFILLIPLIYAFYISLFDWQLTKPNKPFIAFAGYRELFNDPIFIRSFVNTIIYVVWVVFFTCILGLLFAVLLNRNFRGRGIFRSILFIPWGIMPIVVGLLWSWIFNSKFGVFNYLLTKMGLIKEYMPILGSGSYAMYAVIVASVWYDIPFAALLFLAGLQAIPDEYYEAALVDGATKFQVFIRITLPLLRNTLMLVVIFETMHALKVFDVLYAMTAGGPANATTVLSWYVYSTSFIRYNLSKGAAIGIIIAITTLLFAILYIKTLHRKVEY